MSPQEMIAILEAFLAGKPIQRYQILGKGLWEDFDPRDGFDFVNYVYRQLPTPQKPREWWMNVYDDGEVCVHESRSMADALVNQGRIDCVHVREVLP